MRTRSGKEGTNARARFRLYDRVRARQAGKQAGGQPTNSQLSSRIYSRVILAEPRSRNFAPALARRTYTSYDVFYSGTKDCASPLPSSLPRSPPRTFTGPLSLREIGRLSADHRPALYESAKSAKNVSADSASRHLLVIATMVLPPASHWQTLLLLFFVDLLDRASPISDEMRHSPTRVP